MPVFRSQAPRLSVGEQVWDADARRRLRSTQSVRAREGATANRTARPCREAMRISCEMKLCAFVNETNVRAVRLHGDGPGALAAACVMQVQF